MPLPLRGETVRSEFSKPAASPLPLIPLQLPHVSHQRAARPSSTHLVALTRPKRPSRESPALAQGGCRPASRHRRQPLHHQPTLGLPLPSWSIDATQSTLPTRIHNRTQSRWMFRRPWQHASRYYRRTPRNGFTRPPPRAVVTTRHTPRGDVSCSPPTAHELPHLLHHIALHPGHGVIDP